jgi:predicted alpha/beta-hydrolase family hydrolase
MAPELLSAGPADAQHRFVFAHGAGAGMRSEFMEAVARGLGERGIATIRFEFPYMRARASAGRRWSAPDKSEVLMDAWREVVMLLGGGPGVVIGGKSMGGRIATMIADEVGARSVVCFGYPFHPEGKPTLLRTAHLAALQTRTLVVQGTRDALGNRQEVAGYVLSAQIKFAWIEGGDHSLKPGRGAPLEPAAALGHAMDEAAAFIRGA